MCVCVRVVGRENDGVCSGLIKEGARFTFEGAADWPRLTGASVVLPGGGGAGGGVPLGLLSRPALTHWAAQLTLHWSEMALPCRSCQPHPSSVSHLPDRHCGLALNTDLHGGGE